MQVPGFIDDYAKRVDAHRLEAAQNIQGFQQTAGQFFNGSLEELVRHYRSNSDPVFQRDGENLDRLMRRARMLDAESVSYTHLDVYKRQVETGGAERIRQVDGQHDRGEQAHGGPEASFHEGSLFRGGRPASPAPAVVIPGRGP